MITFLWSGLPTQVLAEILHHVVLSVTKAQGIPNSVIQNNTLSTSPIKFETGNDSYTADSCVSLNGSTFGHASFCVMEDCPIVRSLGQIVASGKPFRWLPDQLPFFCQNGDAIQLAFDSKKIAQHPGLRTMFQSLVKHSKRVTLLHCQPKRLSQRRHPWLKTRQMVVT